MDRQRVRLKSTILRIRRHTNISTLRISRRQTGGPALSFSLRAVSAGGAAPEPNGGGGENGRVPVLWRRPRGVASAGAGPQRRVCRPAGLGTLSRVNASAGLPEGRAWRPASRGTVRAAHIHLRHWCSRPRPRSISGRVRERTGSSQNTRSTKSESARAESHTGTALELLDDFRSASRRAAQIRSRCYNGPEMDTRTRLNRSGH
jgi:hypothetical protein